MRKGCRCGSRGGPRIEPAPKWLTFVRILLPGFHAAFPLDPATLGRCRSAASCVPVWNCFTFHIGYPMAVAGRQYQCRCPLVMCLSEDGWRVLNLG